MTFWDFMDKNWIPTLLIGVIMVILCGVYKVMNKYAKQNMDEDDKDKPIGGFKKE